MGIQQVKRLTDRHREILRSSVMGTSTKEIADEFRVDPCTVSRLRTSKVGREYLGQLHERMDRAVATMLVLRDFPSVSQLL